MTFLAPTSTSCDFDAELCQGWRQSCSDVFDWTRQTGSTWSSDTGPDFDHTSGSGRKKMQFFRFFALISFVLAKFQS